MGYLNRLSMKLPDWALAHKEPKTEIKFINGAYYKYAVEYKYNPSKKRTDKITRGLIGKISEDHGFIPSSKQMLKEKADIIPKVDIKIFGVYKLFSSLLSEEIESLSNVLSPEIAPILSTIAMMRFAYQCPLKRIPYLHQHDYCSQDWAIKGLDDKKITNVLRFVGENRNLLVEWMKSRSDLAQSSSGNIVMIDCTHVQSLSRNIHVNAKGYNPDHNHDPQIRLMYIFSARLKQPLYYRLVNGNITDLKSMKMSVEEFGVENVIFIADKGFYSLSNIENLKSNQIHYIIPVHRSNSLIDFKPLEKSDFKQTNKTYFSYQKRIIWYYSYLVKGQRVVTFLDESLRLSEETDYLMRIKSHPDKYNEEGFYARINRFGTLSLVSNLPDDLSPEQLYQAYKQRNQIETMFDSYKNFLEADKTYMQDRFVLEGWLMANFIAMMAYYRLFIRLKEAGIQSKYSPKDITEISKSIYQTKIGQNWRTSEITKKVSDLFTKLNIDYLK